MLLEIAQILAAGYCGEYLAAYNLLNDKGHRKHCSRADTLERIGQNSGCRRFLYVIDRCARRKRIEHAYAHLIGMGKRQDGQEYVLAIYLVCVPGLKYVGAEVAVAS